MTHSAKAVPFRPQIIYEDDISDSDSTPPQSYHSSTISSRDKNLQQGSLSMKNNRPLNYVPQMTKPISKDRSVAVQRPKSRAMLFPHHNLLRKRSVQARYKLVPVRPVSTIPGAQPQIIKIEDENQGKSAICYHQPISEDIIILAGPKTCNVPKTCNRQKDNSHLIQLRARRDKILHIDDFPEFIQIQKQQTSLQPIVIQPPSRPLRPLVKQICPICLGEISQVRGVLQCTHEFCLSCLEQSAKFCTKCPYCRKEFNKIMDSHHKVIHTVQLRTLEINQQRQYDEEPCYVCGRNDGLDELLVCDQCDLAFCHIRCDPELGGVMPEGMWYCRDCKMQIVEEESNRRRRRARRRRRRHH